jgi:DNA replication and repair protein RecF
LRRRWLDLHLASLDAVFLAQLQTYHRAVDARNRLLKAEGSVREIAAFEQQLAPAACALIARRVAAMERLTARVHETFSALTGGADVATMSYRADVTATTPAEMLQVLEQQRPRDVRMQATQRGPHRDDLVLQVHGRDAALFASEGQQRALVLALRFAQLRDARAATGLAPLVLADDVLGELDPARRAHFWSALDPDLQLFASGTQPPVDDTPGGWEILPVRSGEVIR